MGALPLPNPSLPKLNTPGQSPLTTPKLLSVFSPMLGACALTPRRLFFGFDEMVNDIGLSPRITELTDEAEGRPPPPDLATSGPIDTDFTFPSTSQSGRSNGVSSTGDDRAKKGDGKGRFDTRKPNARESSPAEGLVSEGMPGLLALPEVAEEGTEDAREGETDHPSSQGQILNATTPFLGSFLLFNNNEGTKTLFHQ